MLEKWKHSFKHKPNPKQLPEAEPGLFMTLLPTPREEESTPQGLIEDLLKSPGFGADL